MLVAVGSEEGHVFDQNINLWIVYDFTYLYTKWLNMLNIQMDTWNALVKNDQYLYNQVKHIYMFFQKVSALTGLMDETKQSQGIDIIHKCYKKCSSDIVMGGYWDFLFHMLKDKLPLE